MWLSWGDPVWLTDVLVQLLITNYSPLPPPPPRWELWRDWKLHLSRSHPCPQVWGRVCLCLAHVCLGMCDMWMHACMCLLIIAMSTTVVSSTAVSMCRTGLGTTLRCVEHRLHHVWALHRLHSLPGKAAMQVSPFSALGKVCPSGALNLAWSLI